MKNVEEKMGGKEPMIFLVNLETAALKKFEPHNFFRFLLFTFFLLFSSKNALQAQNLPDEIRGYKVHTAKISVTNQTEKTDETEKSEARARLTEPQLIDTSLTGLTFEISAEIEPLEYKGKVDFLTFRDFKVNGLKVEIEEYAHSFEFGKNEKINLPQPVKIFLNSRQALKGALSELRESREQWTVTGTVFVFGRFKKFGFSFKRVVPVEINVKIKNPLRTEDFLTGVLPSL